MGERFLQAREAQGKTLEDAHKKTGITLKVLRQLESDEADAVELVFLRLAARAYADYLGLDPDEAAREVRSAAGGGAAVLSRPVPVKIPMSATPRPSVAVAKEKKGMPLGRMLALGGVGVVILLGLVYVFDQLDRMETVPQPAVAVSVPETAAASDPEPVAQDQAPQASIPPPEAGSAVTPEPLNELDVPPQVEPVVLDESLLLDEAALVLELEARMDTWVRVRWEGGGRWEGIIPKGARRRWEAEQYFRVLSGKPRGFHYWFQNKKVDRQLRVDPGGVLNFKATTRGITLFKQEPELNKNPEGGASGGILSGDDSAGL